jgi:predicted metalloprotease with PDZ domain
MAALAFALLDCGRAKQPAPAPGSWEYVFAPPAAGSWQLAVEATLERAPVDHLVVDGDDAAVRDVVLLGPGDGAPVVAVARGDGGWSVPACRTRCRLRYVVDLDAQASGCRRLDCGRKIGDAILGQASAWMLRPETAGDAVVRVHLAPGAAASDRFATGMRRDPSGGYVFRSEDLGEASYTAFGSFRRSALEVGGARLDVVLLGDPVAMGDAAVVDWVRGAAGCVADLYGRFPVDATVFVVPAAGADDVVFGRVMSLAGASVVLLFGTEARPEKAHGDWVVVHELFHLSSPSFVGEGHWLEEGLATYYEPILRARAGWYSEADLWTELVREMPRGLRQGGEALGLEERDGIDATYWGGAIFALLADLRIRAATQGSARPQSLDDVQRAVLARRGDATHRARVADFIETGDRATGTSALAEVYASWAVRGENVDLAAIWRSLGIEPIASGDGGRISGVRLHDDAPLAAVRKAMAGSRH